MPKLYIHFSVDDVINSLLWLERVQAKSCFESDVLRYLRSIYEKFRIGVTLNCMYSNERGHTLSEVSSRWKDEFENNREWLRFSFHCYDPKSDYSEIPSEFFKLEYNKTVHELCRIVGTAVDNSIIRLHFFYGNSHVVDYLFNNQTKCLLSSDDERISYDLTSNEKQQLDINGEYISRKGMKYVRTNFRVEKYDKAINYRSKTDRLIFFTHESLLMDDDFQKKIITYFETLSKSGDIESWRVS